MLTKTFPNCFGNLPFFKYAERMSGSRKSACFYVITFSKRIVSFDLLVTLKFDFIQKSILSKIEI